MIARTLLVLFFVVSNAGCDFLAPVVTTFPASSPPAQACDLPPACAALAAPPPPVVVAGLLGADDPCGAAGRVQRVLQITQDTSIDADDLACVDLDIEALGEGAGTRVLTIQGSALARSRLHVRSEALRVEVRLEVSTIDRSELTLSGPIAIFSSDVDVVESRLVLDAPQPIAAPSVLFDGGSLVSVEIAGPRALVRMRGVGILGAAFSVDSLALERGRAANVRVGARLLEMLDADLVDAELEVDRFIAASGALRRVHIARCGSVTLAQLNLTDSFVAACDAPVELADVAIQTCAVQADLVGRGGGLRHSVFGSARIAVDAAEITDSALCGTASVDVTALRCVRCEAAAPPELCGSISHDEAFCPGLCASRCGARHEPTLPAELCAP